MSHPAMGKKGRKNCLVMGISRENRSRVAIAVFASGPGASMRVKEKMPMISSNKY